MSDAEIIRCNCYNRRGTCVIAVLLPDGRLEMRRAGKSSIVSGGVVDLNCDRCGFKRELVLDSIPMSI